MRTNRTNRQILKQEFLKLQAENAALKQLIASLGEQLKSGNATTVNAFNSADLPSDNGFTGGGYDEHEKLNGGLSCGNDNAAPTLIGRGFPTRSKPVHAKSLSEAKNILLSHMGEW